MRVIAGWRGLGPGDRGAATAIGNFDGVHRGHQQVIAAAAEAAGRLGAPLAAAIFSPHPRHWFQPEAPPFRLMTDAQRARALAALGVERLHVLPFDADMAAMTDAEFAERVLAGVGPEGLWARHVAAGFDFTFGRGRSGDGDLLRAYGERLGFGVSVVGEVADEDGVKLSSTAVRLALEAGRPEQAGAILGRPFAIEGEVVHGDKRGRELGFPTANVRLGDYLRPRFGVYATRTRLPDGRLVPGVSSLGIRPMFETPEPLLEVWLFDFSGDLYGQTIETELAHFLRPEARLDSLEALTAQVLADADLARRLFAGAA
jgi:riboflavin kinase/FMN adenylyltransferase